MTLLVFTLRVPLENVYENVLKAKKGSLKDERLSAPQCKPYSQVLALYLVKYVFKY